MAWALQFDGVNDYATLDSAVSFADTGEYSISIAVKLDAAPAEDINTLLYLDNNNYLYYRQSNTRFYWKIAGSSVQFVVPTVDVLGVDVVIHLQQTASGAKTISVDGIGTSSTFTALRTFSFDQFVRNGNWEFTGQLSEVVVYSDIAETTAVERWSATDSSHTAGTPVFLNTITSNNATGFNMPTDGSAWFNLGGGGLTLVVSSIASLEAFGTPNIRRAQEVLTVESIQSLEAFGTPSLTIISTIAIPSIESEEAFGLPTVELTSVFVSVDSILTEEEFGTPTIIVGETFVLPVSIASAEAFGTPNVTSIGIVTQHLTVATIFSEEEFGVPDVSLFDKHLLVVSIQSGEEFGKPKILGGVQVTNTLNIPEVTLNQISDANHAINLVGNDIGNARRSVYQSAVVRVIDHDDDDATAVDDPTRMALFESKAHGQPWNKYKGHGEHSIHSGSVIETDTNMNQIFPTFEYNEFE